ncbi:MAG: hypothetical protein E7629_01060 [Ruminococcaceae bacterium]|nr:hypothetical protein [Oscillospiraceae bacterium]
MFSFWKNQDGESPQKIYAWILLLGVIAGVALLFLGNRDDMTGTDPQATDYELSRDEIIIYQNYLEEKVKRLCATVDGVGSVNVIVTLERGFTSEYAVEYRDGNEEYVIIGSGTSQNGLLLGRNAPKIAGVGVVCHGGMNPSVQRELTALLSAALNLPSNRIYVTAARP